MRKSHFFSNSLTKLLAAIIIAAIAFGGLWIAAPSTNPSTNPAAQFGTVTVHAAATKDRFVKADELKVYEKRSTKSEVIKKIKQNTPVEMYTTVKNGWVKIKCEDGTKGFVKKKYLSKTEVSVESLTKQAKADKKKIKKTAKKAGWKLSYQDDLNVYYDKYNGWIIWMDLVFKKGTKELYSGVWDVKDGVIRYSSHYETVSDIKEANQVKIKKLLKFIQKSK